MVTGFTKLIIWSYHDIQRIKKKVEDHGVESLTPEELEGYNDYTFRAAGEDHLSRKGKYIKNPKPQKLGEFIVDPEVKKEKKIGMLKDSEIDDVINLCDEEYDEQ